MVFVKAEEPQAQPQVIDPGIFKKLILVASIAAGVQFVWAVQLTHLTPQTQLLGLSHKDVSFTWLCGPITGLLVQPFVGHHSDQCTSRFGRRRPFLAVGSVILIVAVIVIGYCSDLGHCLGDPTEGFRRRTVELFILGFWLLDIGNNILQGLSRALLADLAGDDDAAVTVGMALFAFFMAVGNIMGYAAGSLEHLFDFLPFTRTPFCNQSCANLKASLILAGIFIGFIVTLVVVFIKEERLDPLLLQYQKDARNAVQEKPPSLLTQMVIAARSTTRPIRILYGVTVLTWIGLFPFQLYGTDWMGKEVYGGQSSGTTEQLQLYHKGVHAGAFGLIFCVIAMGAGSLFLEVLIKLSGCVARLWTLGNFIQAICMAFTVLITKIAHDDRMAAVSARGSSLIPPSSLVKALCILLFALLGVPQAVVLTIPFALASIYSKDTTTGQGLALGLLNLAIVIPQVAMTLISGPLDERYGHSNLPAFVLAGFAATIGAIAALNLPTPEVPTAPPPQPTTDTPGFL